MIFYPIWLELYKQLQVLKLGAEGVTLQNADR